MRRYFLILAVILGLGVGFLGHLDWLSGDVKGSFTVANAQEEDDEEDDDDSEDGGDDGDENGDGGNDGDDEDDDAESDDGSSDDDEDDDDGDDDGDDDNETADEDDRDDDQEDDEERQNEASPAPVGAPLTPQTPATTSDREDRDRFVDSEIMLLTEPDWSESERAALATAGYNVLSQTPLNGLGAVVVRLSLPAGLTTPQALERARTLAPTAIFDFNHVYRPSGEPCSPADCWGQEMVGLASPEPASCPDLGPIAIIDTPVATDHPTLAEADIVARNFVSPGSAPIAEHGTAIAALLVGEPMPGANPLVPGAKLLAAGALAEVDGETRADTVVLLQALDWAISEGARVIGLSIEGDPNSALAFGIRVGAQRASLVAAAGNRGARAAPSYPAAYTDIIAVSAIDRRMRPYRQGTRGDYVEVSAPGVGILSRTQNGEPHVWTGSSFAVPFVAATMLRSQAKTPEDRRAARAKLAQMAKDLGPSGRDRIFGHGLVQQWRKPCA